MIRLSVEDLKDQNQLEFGMQLLLNSELFKPFWAQLFHNIGYSQEYKRHVILEPICYLTEYRRSISKCVPIDPIIYDSNLDLGNEVASFIDVERNDDIEQVLVPYIQNKKYKYILLTDNYLIFPKLRLPGFLNYLKRKPKILERLRILVHYHIDEPRLSKGDLDTMIQYTKEVKSLGGRNQIGMVLSERNPEDTLEIRKSGKKEFIEHLSTKLRMGRIDVVAELFTGKLGFHSPVEIRINF